MWPEGALGPDPGKLPGALLRAPGAGPAPLIGNLLRMNLFRTHGSTIVPPAHAMACSARRFPLLGSFRSELCLALTVVQHLKSRGERLAYYPPRPLTTYLIS